MKTTITVTIGGCLRVSYLMRLRSILDAVGLSFGGLGLLLAAAKGATTLALFSNDARVDELSRLTRFCVRHRLTYHLCVGAHAKYDTRQHWWKPGMDGPAAVRSTVNGQVLIELAELADWPDVTRAAMLHFIERHTPIDVPVFRVD